MKKVFLTGASGFVGVNCCEALLAKGFEVHAISSSVKNNNYSQQFRWHHLNLHDADHLRRVIEEIKPDYLMHLAWEVTPGVCWNSMENMRWLQTSLNLYKAFIETGGRRAVMVGSCAEYDWSYGYCSEEITPLKPYNLYGVCKNALNSVSAAMAVEAGISSAWARLFFLYGPCEHPDRLVASVTSSLLNGEEALCTLGEQFRDYLYIKDAAAALVRLLQSDVEGAVNVASGQPQMVRDVISTTAELIGRSDLVRLGALPLSVDEPEFLIANTERLTEEVGWEPQFSLKQGLEETINWWKNKLGHYS